MKTYVLALALAAACLATLPQASAQPALVIKPLTEKKVGEILESLK